MTLTQEICNRLHEAALKITDNFCYGCYKVVEGDRCSDCFSDDFMRHLPSKYYDHPVASARLCNSSDTVDSRAGTPGPVRPVGVEYGTDWVVRHLLTTRLEAVDGEEMFEELLDECYPEVKIGNSVFSPSQVLKELDPIAFNIGVDENLQSLAEDGVLFEFDGDYYRLEDLEDLLEELEAEHP